jgi:hypothetical protein
MPPRKLENALLPPRPSTLDSLRQVHILGSKVYKNSHSSLVREVSTSQIYKAKQPKMTHRGFIRPSGWLVRLSDVRFRTAAKLTYLNRNPVIVLVNK